MFHYGLFCIIWFHKIMLIFPYNFRTGRFPACEDRHFCQAVKTKTEARTVLASDQQG